MKLRRCLLAVLLVLSGWAGSSSASLMSPITVDGRDWLQPIDFSNMNWFDLNAVCNAAAGGVCVGSLGGNDITGYTWASVDDVNALFNSYLPGDPLGPGPSYDVGPSDTFAAAFFADGWLPTSADPVRGSRSVDGWSRSLNLYDAGYAYRPSMATVVPIPGFFPADVAITDVSGLLVAADSGGWFYRNASTEVPVPPTLPLLGLGIAALGFSHRKRKLHS
jgi:hypothetical protein